MKLALSSGAVANTSSFPVGIIGAIVSNGWGDDGLLPRKHSGEFDTLSDRRAKRNRREL